MSQPPYGPPPTVDEPRRWSTPAFTGTTRFTDEQYREALEYAEQQRGKPYPDVWAVLDDPDLSDFSRQALALILMGVAAGH